MACFFLRFSAIYWPGSGKHTPSMNRVKISVYWCCHFTSIKLAIYRYEIKSPIKYRLCPKVKSLSNALFKKQEFIAETADVWKRIMWLKFKTICRYINKLSKMGQDSQVFALWLWASYTGGERTYNSDNENIYHLSLPGMQRGIHQRISIQIHIIW